MRSKSSYNFNTGTFSNHSTKPFQLLSYYLHKIKDFVSSIVSSYEPKKASLGFGEIDGNVRKLTDSVFENADSDTEDRTPSSPTTPKYSPVDGINKQFSFELGEIDYSKAIIPLRTDGDRIVMPLRDSQKYKRAEKFSKSKQKTEIINKASSVESALVDNHHVTDDHNPITSEVIGVDTCCSSILTVI